MHYLRFDYRCKCATKKVDGGEVGRVAFDDTCYQFKKRLVCHRLICHDLAVNLFQSYAFLAATNSSLVYVEFKSHKSFRFFSECLFSPPTGTV